MLSYFHYGNNFSILCMLTELKILLNLLRIGIFEAAQGGVEQKGSLPKICHTYLTVMKLGTVIPYLKKTQKIYESRDTPLDLCWNQLFYCKIANFVISENTDIDCILVHFWDFKGFFNKNGYNFDNVTKIGYSRAS